MPPETGRIPSSASPAASAWALRDHLAGVRLELGLGRLAQRDRLGRDRVHQRAALGEREDRLVDPLGQRLRGRGSCRRAGRAAPCAWWRRPRRRTAPATGSPAPATRPMKCAASTIRYAPTSSAISRNAREVDQPRVRRRAADDHLRPVRQGEVAHLVVVDQLGVRAGPCSRPVWNHLPEKLTRLPWVRCPPCGRSIASTVSPGCTSAAYAARLALAPRVRLQVGVLGAEELLRPGDADLLGPVHLGAAAVVAPARVALGVLVGQRRAERGQHRRRGEVLAGDQLQAAAQPVQLAEHHLGDLRVGRAAAASKSGPQKVLAHRRLRRQQAGSAATLTGPPWRLPPRWAARPSSAATTRTRRRDRAGQGSSTAASGWTVSSISSATRLKHWSPRPHGSSRSSAGSAAAPCRAASTAATRATPRAYTASGVASAGGSAAASTRGQQPAELAQHEGARRGVRAQRHHVLLLVGGGGEDQVGRVDVLRAQLAGGEARRRRRRAARTCRAAGGFISSPACQPPVPALWLCSSSSEPAGSPEPGQPLPHARARSSRSAIGERQMLPMQTCRTVNGGTQTPRLVEDVRHHVAQLLQRDRAQPRSTRGTSPVRSTIVLGTGSGHGPGLQVGAHRVAELVAGLLGGDRRPAGRSCWPRTTAIGPVSRSTSSATGCSGIRTATVPLVSPRSHCRLGECSTTMVSAPGQNASTRSRAAWGSEKHQAVEGVPGADQHRRRHVPAPALRVQQRLDRVRGERVGADAVDRVGRQDDQLTVLDRLDGGGDAAVPFGERPAVVEHHEEPVCHAAAAGGVLAVRPSGRGGEPRPAGQVAVLRDRGEPAVRGEQRRHRRAVRVVVLDAEHARRGAAARAARRDQRPDHLQPVRRRRRPPRPGRARPPRAAPATDRGHVRRVAQHHVDPADQLGEQRPGR